MKKISANLFLSVISTITTAVFGQSNLEFTSCRPQTNREVSLQFSALTGQVCRLEVSTNLATWQRAVTWLPTRAVVDYTDPVAPFCGQRFYRLLSLPETNVPLGDHFLTAEGEVVVRQLSLATLLLAWEGKYIYVDICQDNLGIAPLSNFAGLPKADLVLITHDHPDHLEQYSAPVLRRLLTTNSVIICSLGAFNAFYSTQDPQYPKTNILKGLNGVTVLTNGATTQVMGIGIQAIPSYNVSSLYHPRAAHYSGYLVTLGGRRLYFSGDTDAIPEMLALRDIDIAFIPIIGSPATMDPSQAVAAVRQFRPKVVYPYHRSPGAETTFKRLLGTGEGIEVRVSSWW